MKSAPMAALLRTTRTAAFCFGRGHCPDLEDYWRPPEEKITYFIEFPSKMKKLVEKSRFWWPKSRFKSIKKMLWLPNFKGRACKLDFPALHESNFAAYFTGCQILGPVKSIFESEK